MDSRAHEAMCVRFPKFLGIVDEILSWLFGLVSHNAFNLVVCLVLVVLGLAGVDWLVLLCIGLSWLISILAISRSEYVKKLHILSRLLVVAACALALGFSGRSFGHWAIEKYHRQQGAEAVKKDSAKEVPATQPALAPPANHPELSGKAIPRSLSAPTQAGSPTPPPPSKAGEPLENVGYVLLLSSAFFEQTGDRQFTIIPRGNDLFNVHTIFTDETALHALGGSVSGEQSKLTTRTFSSPEMDKIIGFGDLMGLMWHPQTPGNEHYNLASTHRRGMTVEDLWIEKEKGGWYYAMQITEVVAGKVVLECKDPDFPLMDVLTGVTAKPCIPGILGNSKNVIEASPATTDAPTAHQIPPPTFTESGKYYVLVGSKDYEVSKESTQQEPTEVTLLGESPSSIKTYVERGTILVDALLDMGHGKEPIKLIHNELQNRPPRWDMNEDSSAIEVVDENLTPRFQLVYRDHLRAQLCGVFSFTNRALIANQTNFHFYQGSSYRESDIDIHRLFAYPSRLHAHEELAK
jgi:hypothetical protein